MSNSPRKNRRQKKSLLSKVRWAGYAAAGAATVLGAQEAAEAGIHYFDIDPDVQLDASQLEFNTQTVSHFIQFSPDQNPQDVLLMKHKGFLQYGSAYGAAKGSGVGGGQIAGFVRGGYTWAYNLQYGSLVSAKQFKPAGTLAYFFGYPDTSQFGSPGIGYVGFSFDVGPGTQYGWLKVDMAGTPHNAYSLLEYAYADPGEAIAAGQVPEPGSLGLLATGAVGLLLWRLKRRGSKPAA